jgi:hypothetical protein
MDARLATRLLLAAAGLFAAALFLAAYFQADLAMLIRIAEWGCLGLAVAGAAVGLAAWLGSAGQGK